MNQIAGAIIDQPIVFNGRWAAVETDAKMLAAKVDGRIYERVAGGGGDGIGGYGGVGRPHAIRENSGIADKAISVARNGSGVFADVGGAVVIVTVTIGDIAAVTIVEFDLESVTDVTGVIDRIKIVDGTVRDAGARLAAGKDEHGSQASGFEQTC